MTTSTSSHKKPFAIDIASSTLRVSRATRALAAAQTNVNEELLIKLVGCLLHDYPAARHIEMQFDGRNGEGEILTQLRSVYDKKEDFVTDCDEHELLIGDPHSNNHEWRWATRSSDGTLSVKKIARRARELQQQQGTLTDEDCTCNPLLTQMLQIRERMPQAHRVEVYVSENKHWLMLGTALNENGMALGSFTNKAFAPVTDPDDPYALWVWAIDTTHNDRSPGHPPVMTFTIDTVLTH